ncbi:MAG: TrkH family potassium uptake protein [SAR324 cluster bacterium]|nr:TrkH family potassium uptake protein [SAR324 cluster bacterium]
MSVHPVFRYVGATLAVVGMAQTLPLAAAHMLGEPERWMFGLSALCAAGAGALLIVLTRNAGDITDRDGFSVATFCFVAAAVAGALPYLLGTDMSTFTDAIFESMSGFTTTGASIVTDYAGLSQSILLWRSLTQWLGGLGILVFAVVILPALGIGGMQIYKREVPGTYSENIGTRIRNSARGLWLVYVVLTVLAACALYVLGMRPLEALNHALTAVSTGGFSTRAASVGAFASPAIEWTLVVFMLLGGMNFTLHYRCVMRRGQKAAHLADLEWRWFIAIGTLVSLSLAGYLAAIRHYALPEAFTKGAFQAVSILTTTGYHSDNYVRWGAFPQLLLLLGMFVGGCTGSTSGGVKMARVILVFKYIGQEMLRLVHPRAVIHVRLGRIRVNQDMIENIQAYFFLYLISLAVVTLLIALDNNGFMTSLGTGVSALSNIGPGFGETGPGAGYAHLSAYSKWVITVAMLLGRLELMTVFVLFTPAAWRA